MTKLNRNRGSSIAVLFLYMTINKTNINIKPSLYNWYFKIWIVIPLSLKKKQKCMYKYLGASTILRSKLSVATVNWRTKFHWYFQTYSSILHQNSNLIFWFINDFYYCCDCKKWEQSHWVFKCKNYLPSRVRKYCSKCKIRLKSSANILHKPEYEAHHQ